MIKTITIDELTVNMYVQDVEWSNNQYKVKSKGLVKSQQTIEQLKKQGVVRLVVETNPIIEDSEEVSAVTNQDNGARQSKVIPQSIPLNNTSVEEEFAISCQLYDSAAENVRNLFLNASRDEKLSPETICVLAEEITKSLARNQYAMTILTRIRHHSTYQWEHAMNCGVLMCGFALFLGFPKELVTQLALGAMLHDIGVAKVSRGIIDKKSSLTPNDMSVMKKHIIWGREMCIRDGFTSKIIAEMVSNHHERLDGSGYPRGLKADKLSKLSRMIAIIDVYDAITGEKTYKTAKQPIDALRYLLGKKDLFDQTLVQQFIKYIGVHPVGSLVKLSDDKLAIVIEGNRKNPVKPVVKIFFCVKNLSYITAKVTDLATTSTSIISAVNAEEFGINLARTIRNTLS